MKKTVVFLTAVLFAAELFAQTSDALQQEEAIELPEVTTVVSGVSIKAGKEAVPDYKEILPDTSSSELELPEMNQVNTQNVPQSSFKVLSPWKKTVFAEGRIAFLVIFQFTDLWEMLLSALIFIMNLLKVLETKIQKTAFLNGIQKLMQ